MQPTKGESKTIIVPYDFSTIEKAVKVALPGDTIIVKEGIYKEGEIEINKTITILAEGEVVIDGCEKMEHALIIRADEVTVSGFTMQNFRKEWGYYTDSSILIFAYCCKITKNKILNNSRGIWIKEGGLNIISENYLFNNTLGIAVSSARNSITKNRLIKHERAIEVSGKLNEVEENTIINDPEEELTEGILTSSENFIVANTISYSYDGIQATGKNNTILENFVNVSRLGISVISTDNVIERNKVQYAWIGISISDSNNLVIANSVNCTFKHGIEIETPEVLLGRWTEGNIVIWNKITWVENGIHVRRSIDNIIGGNEIINGLENGIFLESSNYNDIFQNIVSNFTEDGIRLSWSDHNYITRNIIQNNGDDGVCIVFVSCHNTVYLNNILENGEGICVSESPDNDIYHNNFIDNKVQCWSYASSGVLWDDGYPSGGNYWSDYKGKDEKSGWEQDQPGSDGIGDTPQCGDRYPFMEPIAINPLSMSGIFRIWWEKEFFAVELTTPSIPSNLVFDQPNKEISFNIKSINSEMPKLNYSDLVGATERLESCNISIPKMLLRDNPWRVLLNGSETVYKVTYNQTHSLISFLYTVGYYDVRIIGTEAIPEFQEFILLMSMMSVTAMITLRRITKTKKFHFPLFFCFLKI
jgi:parallel beta-helix repeat protein